MGRGDLVAAALLAPNPGDSPSLLDLGPPLAAPRLSSQQRAFEEAAWAPHDFLGRSLTSASKSASSRSASASFLGLAEEPSLPTGNFPPPPSRTRTLRTSSFVTAKVHGGNGVHAANLSTHDEQVLVEASKAEAKAKDMAFKADNILDEAIKAAHVSKKAVKIAWFATFMACITGSVAAIGTGVDWMILRRDKRGIEEQKEELAATGWPSWRVQMEAQRLGLQTGGPGADPFLLDPTSPSSDAPGGGGPPGGTNGGAPSGSPPPPSPPSPPGPPPAPGGGGGGGGVSSVPPKAFPVPPKAGSSTR